MTSSNQAAASPRAGILTGAFTDFRQTFRLLWKAKRITATTLVTLALCIGATTAIFSSVYSLMLKPLPYQEPERIVELYSSAAKAGLNRMPANVPFYLDYSQNASSYESLGLWTFFYGLVGEKDSVIRTPGVRATAEIFNILRVQPVLGTFFTKEQNKQGADKVIVLTQSYWQTQYQESPEVIGKDVRIDDEAYKVIGVAPRILEAFDARGGTWTGAGAGRTFDRHNPARTDELVSTAPDSDAADVSEAIGHVAEHYEEWARVAPDARADVLSRAAGLLERDAATLVEELVREEGKTRAEAAMEVRRTPQNLRFYAGEALRTTGETYPAGDGSLVFTVRQPVGVVAAITPWNFPLNIPSRKLGPALAAGNGVVFKPSELTPLLGQRLVEALLEAGVPGSALALVHGHAEVGKALVSDSRVDAVTFTGSTGVGEAIHANVAPWVRCQLEMGGKNAVFVTEDADLDKAADIVVKGAFGLSGQACTGTSRVVVHESVLNGLLDRVMERARGVVLGNGLDEGVTMGPLASAAQLEKYHAYLEIGKDTGATLETPLFGCAPEGGHFARPAIFTGVHQDSRLAQEEIFAPILSFLPVASYDEAVGVVNNSPYGLSAGIVTTSVATAMAFARDARAGLVKVNQPTNGMAMNAPFGGMKRSSTQTFKEQAGASMMQFYTHDKTTYFSS